MPAALTDAAGRAGVRGGSSTVDSAEGGAISRGYRLMVVLTVTLAILAAAAIGFGTVAAAVAVACLIVLVPKYLTLQANLRSSATEVRALRARILVAVDEEREKIERDLHDGLQQRLIGLQIKLDLTAERVEGRDEASADAIRALERDIDETIQEVRWLARGVNPTTLARTGLGPALTALGFGTVPPTAVRVGRLGRYSPEVERAVYFSCSEALQNAVKHARGATSVTISAWVGEGLEFVVRDDGNGFDPATTPGGAGLKNLESRLAAVGGELRIRSAPGRGTVVHGSIPTRRTGEHTTTRRRRAHRRITTQRTVNP